MFDKFLKLFRKNRDTLVFQISQDFIEVTALRQDEEEVKRHGGLCLTEALYTKRMPISRPSNKRVLDELAQQITDLTNVTVTSRKLTTNNFNIKNAKVACVLVAPISIRSITEYEQELEVSTKITEEVLRNTLVEENIIKDTLKDSPKDYAIYLDEVLGIELNGYNTHKPLGKSAASLKLMVAKYLIEPKIWKAVGIVLEKSFHREIKYIHAEAELDVSDTEFCNEIYTVTQLQEVTNDIL